MYANTHNGVNMIKQYKLEDVNLLLKRATENEQNDVVRLYTSQRRMIENYQNAYSKALKVKFAEDVDYPAITPKSDRWRYGFIKTFNCKEATFTIEFDENRYSWVESMFESVLKRLDLDSVSEWQATVLQTEEVQEQIRVMIEYYRPSGYFKSYIRLYDAGKNLNQTQYEKLCKNKYADKVLAAHFSEPLFKVGDLVSIRGSDRSLQNRGLHKGMFVVSNTETITSARKGCKKYKLLPVGGVKPLFYEEFQLKKYKKPKK